MKKCEWCGKEHKRKRFCSNKCKDKFHNYYNPRGKFAHLKDINDDMEFADHPFSDDAIGQS